MPVQATGFVGWARLIGSDGRCGAWTHMCDHASEWRCWDYMSRHRCEWTRCGDESSEVVLPVGVLPQGAGDVWKVTT